MKMTHTRLLVSNYHDCFLFYRDTMGFSVSWGDENGFYADFDADGHVLALFGKAPMAYMMRWSRRALFPSTGLMIEKSGESGVFTFVIQAETCLKSTKRSK
jgi:catechol 2,3-dioxygenase-like lactoylglutathione lyase family enzyme